jgi:hypothetical protein
MTRRIPRHGCAKCTVLGSECDDCAGQRRMTEGLAVLLVMAVCALVAWVSIAVPSGPNSLLPLPIPPLPVPADPASLSDIRVSTSIAPVPVTILGGIEVALKQAVEGPRPEAADLTSEPTLDSDCQRRGKWLYCTSSDGSQSWEVYLDGYTPTPAESLDEIWRALEEIHREVRRLNDALKTDQRPPRDDDLGEFETRCREALDAGLVDKCWTGRFRE